jgi:phosphoglycerate kinase
VAVLTLEDLLRGPGGVRGQRIFVRADLNVPMRAGRIGDDARIRAALPTLRRLLAGGARVVLASHLGRPKGSDPELSLRPVAARLGERLGREVRFCPHVVGPEAEAAAAALRDGEVLLLENVRFERGETQNDPELSRRLARLADAYVNDAFGTAHRAHATTVGMVAHVPRVAAGDLMLAELDHLRVVREPERPLLCLLGGAKVSDKLAVLEALAPHADVLAIGGAMAYTFLRAAGEPVGRSLVEEERLADAAHVAEAARHAGRRLLLPVDHVVAEKVDADAPARVVTSIPDGWMGLDIGPQTAALYASEAGRARTIFWNGPMGVFELDPFARGTEAVARAVAGSSARSVVGGGDSLAAVAKVGVADRIGHLSTGGGASLEYIQGLTLPGVAALERP